MGTRLRISGRRTRPPVIRTTPHELASPPEASHRLWYLWPLTSTVVYLAAFPAAWALSRMRIDRGELIWGGGLSGAYLVLSITIIALVIGIPLLVAAWSVALTDMRACRDDPGRSPSTALVVFVGACPAALVSAVNVYIIFGPVPARYR